MEPLERGAEIANGFVVIVDARAVGADRTPMHAFVERRAHEIDALLKQYGAVILRNFAPQSVEALGRSIGAVGGDEVFYRGGLGPRTKMGERVYTASDISKYFPIKVHQEMSYQEEHPDKVAFYCRRPARKGGETPIVSMRRVTKDIPQAALKKFDRLGVRYVSVFHDRNRRLREAVKSCVPLYLHLTWQRAFGSDDQAEVERECARRALKATWRADGDLETTAILPALRRHPETDETLWFNSASNLHFNRRTLQSDFGDLLYYFRKLAYTSYTDFPNQVYFGDGSPIAENELEPVYAAIERHAYHHDWREGDLMLLDNYLVAHGRNSYRGKRVVLASLIKNQSQESGARTSSDAAPNDAIDNQATRLTA